MSTDMARAQAQGIVSNLQELEAQGFGEESSYESVYDYLEGQILDVRYTVNSDRELVAVELLTGFGGPNIWETFRRGSDDVEVRVSWYCDPVTEVAHVPALAGDVWSVFEEMFSC